MGMSDNKILQSDFTGKDVSSLSDTPSADGIGATALKQQFDAAVKQVIAVKFNALIDFLMSANGASAIGVSGTGTSGSTVAAQLQSIQAQLTGITQGSVADNSITDAKLSTEAGNLLARFSAHQANRSIHLTDIGTTQGTASAYIIESNDYTGDGLYLVQFHVACADSPTITINSSNMDLVSTGSSDIYAGQILKNGIYILYVKTNVCRVMNPEPISVYA